MPAGSNETEPRQPKQQDQDRAPNVLFSRGVDALRRNQAAEAATLFEEAISIRRARPLYHFKLAHAYQVTRDIEQAAKAFENTIRLQPDLWQAQLGLGLIYFGQGKRKESARFFKEVLRCIASSFAERMWLIPRRIGAKSSAQAKYGQLGKSAVSARALHAIGLALESRGKLEKAIVRYRAASKIDPECTEALKSLGQALIKSFFYKEAAQQLERARGLEPKDPETLAYLGLALAWLAKFDEAEPPIDEALALSSDGSDALFAKGWLLQLTGDPDSATACFEKALAQAPKMIDAHLGLGTNLRDLGRFEEAAQCIKQVLSLDPGNGYALQHLSRSRKFTANDPELAAVRRALCRRTRPTQEQIRLHYAAGKMFDDIGEVDEAFDHYRRGNDLFDVRFDTTAHAEHISALIRTFSPAFFEQTEGYGDPSERPLFIVGMPRSGTTLVEQIIASHPRAFGAGELQDMIRLKERLPELTQADTPYPDCVSRIGQGLAGSLARKYLKKLQELSADADRVTDKMPGNFLHLGLIALLFPKARIIHCMRNPLDTCVSIYLTPLYGWHPYACSLTHLGHYYREYQRLMDHWRDVLPLPCLDLVYEDLVADQEGVSRQIIDFCGLEWDERCLTFYDTKRAVQTSSSEQVRRPVSSASIGRWKRYEAHLGALKEAIGTKAG